MSEPRHYEFPLPYVPISEATRERLIEREKELERLERAREQQQATA